MRTAKSGPVARRALYGQTERALVGFIKGEQMERLTKFSGEHFPIDDDVAQEAATS